MSEKTSAPENTHLPTRPEETAGEVCSELHIQSPTFAQQAFVRWPVHTATPNTERARKLCRSSVVCDRYNCESWRWVQHCLVPAVAAAAPDAVSPAAEMGETGVRSPTSNHAMIFVPLIFALFSTQRMPMWRYYATSPFTCVPCWNTDGPWWNLYFNLETIHEKYLTVLQRRRQARDVWALSTAVLDRYTRLHGLGALERSPKYKERDTKHFLGI